MLHVLWTWEMMNSELEAEFETLMVAVLRHALAQAQCELPHEAIYAIVIYPASGFHGMTVAVNTKEQLATAPPNGSAPDAELAAMLRDHPDLKALATQAPATDPEVTVSEWPHVFAKLPQLDRIDEIVDEAYDWFHESEATETSIRDWFSSAVTAAVNTFADMLEDRDSILLGLQFCDASIEELMLVERVSKRVNAMHWHSKVQSMCMAMKGSQQDQW